MSNRHRFAAVLGLLLTFAMFSACVRASAATGISALDDPAIAVKDPAKVTLVAITRAGNRLVAVGVHGVIALSDDNGQSWRQASVPVGVLLTAVKFATPTDGWAVGHFGVVLHTSDAGASWQVQLTGDQVNKLILDNANAALAANPNSDAAQRAVHRAGFFTAGGPDKPFLTLLVSDPNNLIVFGAYRMAVKSTDGGKDWTDWSLHFDDPLSHHLYGVANVGGDIFIAGEAGHDFVSTDGGNDFTQTPSPSASDATMFGALDTGDNGVLLYGVAGQAYTSHDDGKSWQPAPLGTTQNLTAATALTSGAIVVGAEDGSLYISFNHAKTFAKLTQVLPMAIFDLTQAADGDVVVAGNLGVMRLPAGDFNQN